MERQTRDRQRRDSPAGSGGLRAVGGARGTAGCGGFSLVELMAAVVISGILASIALPAYSDYVTKGRSRTAQSDLVSLSLSMENFYQQNLDYPTTSTTTALTQQRLIAACGGTTTSTTYTWYPAQSADFTYKISASSGCSAATDTYTLQAVGASTAMSGCTITLTSANSRTLTSQCKTGSTTW